MTSDFFAAGISSYGIGDLRSLVEETHKAESHYTFALVAPWPEGEQVYRERSPITRLDRLNAPMLILQGLEDRVVPPGQAFDMADAVRAKGLALALVTFEHEGHGFRSLAFLESALDRQDDDGVDHGEDQTADGEDPVVGRIEDQLAEPTGEQGTEGTEGGGGDPAAAFLPGHDRLGDAAADQAVRD